MISGGLRTTTAILVMKIVVSLLCLVVPVAAATSKCYALALSGSGDKVAWEAGVVKGLVERMKSTPEERQWSVITGIGMGSIVASAAALFDIGQEEAMAEFISDSTLKFSNYPGTPHVWKDWPAGTNAQNETGSVDTAPLYETLVGTLKQRTLGNRKFTIGATDDVTGKLTVWDETSVRKVDGSVDFEKWATFLLASTSVPGMFQSVKIDGTVYSSNSLSLGTNVFSAVNRCKDAGYVEEDIVMDVVTCDREQLAPWNQTINDFSYPLMERAQEITDFNQLMADILDACRAYPKLSWRYYVQGPKDLPSNGTTFNGTLMKDMLEIGLKSATAAPIGTQCQAAEAHRHSKTVPPGPNTVKASSNGQGCFRSDCHRKCYAMAISGGGAKGAYEAGVIKGLVDRMKWRPWERQWEFVTGISAGSILASGMAGFDIGDEEAMTEFMVDAMMNLTNWPLPENVYIPWPGGWGQGWTETGLYNTTPLYDTLVRLMSQHKVGNRKFTIAATDMVSGALRYWDETSVLKADGTTDYKKWATYIRASAAVPCFFESVKIDDVVYNDGQTVMGTNIFSAVNRCKDAGYAEEDIVMDVVTANSNSLASWNQTANDKTEELAARGATIKQFNQEMADIFDACQAYPKINWRYYARPPVDLPGSAADFNATVMQEMLQVGLKDAAVAQKGTQCSFAEKHRHSNTVPHYNVSQKKAVPTTSIVIV